MNQRENNHTFFEQEPPSFTNLPELKNNKSRDAPSILDEKFPNEGVLQPRETQSSFHFMDYIQESPREDNRPLAQVNNFINDNKLKKPAPSKSQKVKVGSNPRLKDNDQPLTINAILGQMESPMAPLNNGSQTKSESNNRLVSHVTGISNFWVSPDETPSYAQGRSQGRTSKRGQVSDRWLVDTMGSEDDRTDRMWKRQSSTNQRARVFGEDLARDDDSYFKSHTERRRDEEPIEQQIARREYNMRQQQQNQEFAERPNTRASERSRRRQARENANPVHDNPESIPEQIREPEEEEAENVDLESNDQQAPQDEDSLQNDSMSLLDKQLLLKRCIAFYLALSLICLTGLFAIFEFSTPQLMFVVGFAYMVYFGIESGFRVKHNNREDWRKREELFNAFDAICGITLLILIQLKSAGHISWSIAGFGPFAFISLAYFVASTAPDRVKYRKVFIRFSYSFQVFFITAKLDSIIQIDWRIAFGMVWICLGLIALYLVAYTLMLILAIIFGLIGQKLFDDIGMGLQFIGLIWYLLFYGLSAVGYLIVLGIGETFEEQKGYKTLKLAFIIGFNMNILLVVYTLVAFKPLAKFLQAFNKIENTPPTVTSPLERRPEDQVVSLQVEKKESYFVMLSSTYFSPLKNTIFYKNDEKLKKIKDMVLGFRLWKPKAIYEESLQEVNLAPPVDIKVLKEYKQDLDEKFSRIAANQTHDDLTTSRSARSHRGRPSAYKIDIPVKPIHEHKMSFADNTEAIKSSRRLNLSADDMNMKEIVGQKESEPSLRQENLCYLCYDSPPNAVLMHCGHGGICYTCANALVLKKNECMECRRPVEFIYKVDPNPKMKDIVKAVEICKVSLGYKDEQ